MTRLEQLRLDAGLSPEALGALIADVSGRTIRRVEASGNAHPATLAALSAHFGVPASDLVREALPVVGRAFDAGDRLTTRKIEERAA